MTGNDIVDLTLAKTDSWKRTGYLQKIFTASEQEIVKKYSCPESIVWLLWSMKESAYTCYVKETGKTFYAPLKFECCINYINKTNASGRVSFQNSNYTTTSEILKSSIHTIASGENSRNFKTNTYKIKFSRSDYNTQHNEIYSSIKESAAALSSIQFNNLELIKNICGIPEIFSGRKKLDIDLTLSHHGYHGAYVLSC